jgi:hypothetical protein
VKYTKAQAIERERALTELRKLCPVGSTVYTVLRSVSRSGMSRQIGVVLITEDGTDLHPNYLVSTVTGIPTNRAGDGLRVGGCGMDMGFHLVYELSSVLYPAGFRCIGKARRCPSNDHSNRETRRTHPDGGYALRHRWL